VTPCIVVVLVVCQGVYDAIAPRAELSLVTNRWFSSQHPYGVTKWGIRDVRVDAIKAYGTGNICDGSETFWIVGGTTSVCWGDDWRNIIQILFKYYSNIIQIFIIQSYSL